MEEQEQEQEQQQPNPFSYGGQTNSDLVKLALQPQDIIEQLRIELLALEWNDQKQKYVRQQGMKPLISEKGLNPLLSLVRSQINRNTTLSNLKEETSKYLAGEVERTVNNYLLEYYAHNPKEFNRSNWQMITIMCGNQTMFAFNRAINGGEMNILGGGTKTIKSIQEVQGTQRIIEGKKGWGVFK